VSGTVELIVVVAGTAWDGPWLCERQMAPRLAKRAVVLWVDPPTSHLTGLRGRASRAALKEPRLRAVCPNVMRLTPVTVPGVSRPGLRSIAARQTRRAIRDAVEYLELPVRSVIVASLADMLDVVPSRRSVFYGTDDFAAGAALMGIDREWAERRTAEQLAKADAVVACSEVIAERWSAERDDIVVIPNGCDAERLADSMLAPTPPEIALPRPIAGFVGHMSDRIDHELLAAVADAGISLLLIGPRQATFDLSRLEALLERPNVQWLGSRPFERIPEYLGAIDVGLTPYVHSAFNEASSPLKTLDYLAAGLPVVATDLPAHRELPAAHVRLATGPADFAAATAEVLAEPGDPAAGAERREIAAGRSWSVSADLMAGLIGLPERQRARA
jgi:teichuronic acid biosynthesis glycosyltransferase TuaH